MVTGTRAGLRMKTKIFKRRYLPHHKSQRRDIRCIKRPVIFCFAPNFVDRSVLYDAKERRVKFRRSFGNIRLAECNVSVPNVRSFGTKPKAPVTDYRNRGSGNHTLGSIKAFKLIFTFPKCAKMHWVMIIVQRRLWDTNVRRKALESHYAGYVKRSAVKTPCLIGISH